MSEKTIVTYTDYDHMLDKLIDMIQMTTGMNHLKYVYGPPRGGKPLAVHLSHHLDLQYLTEFDFINLLKDKEKVRQVLIVDDICDTGKTLFQLRKHITGVSFISAVLFVKDRAEYKPTFHVKRDNNWIVFPWEKLDETPNRKGYEDL